MSLFKRSRIAGVLLFLLLFPLMANAYTVVFRDGRRVTIPDNFTVTPSTITYEAGTNIQITLQLVTIDITATERANNESAGSLLRKVRPATTMTTASAERRSSTVTNQDLEKFRVTRVASEAAYEQRRKELGLPSAEESRLAALASAERAQAQLLNSQLQDQQSEGYWRNRANELRTEMAVTDERIAFVRSRLNELPLNYSFGSFATIGPVFNRVSPFVGVDQLARGAVVQPFGPVNRAPRFVARASFGTGIRGQVFMNTFPRNGFQRRPFFNNSPFGSVAALPFNSYDNYEGAALSGQLNDLLAYRAGLQARWRALEDEARRAGAYPGWLR
jgi:hypothetical protein